jgi:hypothetical protein
MAANMPSACPRHHRPNHHRPSRARCIAGLSGFLVLIQSPERPDRYGLSSRFDTMPSSPIRRACSNTAAVSLCKAGSSVDNVDNSGSEQFCSVSFVRDRTMHASDGGIGRCRNRPAYLCPPGPDRRRPPRSRRCTSACAKVLSPISFLTVTYLTDGSSGSWYVPGGSQPGELGMIRSQILAAGPQ